MFKKKTRKSREKQWGRLGGETPEQKKQMIHVMLVSVSVVLHAFFYSYIAVVVFLVVFHVCPYCISFVLVAVVFATIQGIVRKT